MATAVVTVVGTEVAKVAVKTALGSLVKLIQYEWFLDKTVKDGLTSLQTELKYMQSSIENVSIMAQDQINSVNKIWLTDVKELSYTIETSLQSFTSSIESIKGTLLSALNKFLINHQIASFIKGIMIKVKEVSERRGRYDYSTSKTSFAHKVDPRIFGMYEKKSALVGLGGATDELTKMLSTCDHVSIVGMGGMGKTTLAQAVYGKLQMKGEFSCCAFVTVGQNACGKKVLKDILYELEIESNGGELNEMQLINKLQKSLVGKRCLFFIDDIWDNEAVKLIKCALVDNPESRIITTTRKLEVVKQFGGVYMMKLLSDTNSRELLHTRISRAEANSNDSEFARMSDKILSKCGGVPLAIVTIASLLAKKPREWSRVYDSIGFSEHEEEDVVKDIRSILSFSYYDLPRHLQKCFLYLSLFPKGHWIEKNMLIWRWVAEGLVPGCNEKKVELFELGETYFNELIDRSMIQRAVSPRDIGQGGCRIHEMMLDLIRDLSSSDKENFSTVLDGNQESTSQALPIHRLAIHGNIVDETQKNIPTTHTNPNTSLKVGTVQSFYASSCPGSSLPRFSKFARLRAIDLKDCNLSVGNHKLKHLSKSSELAYVGLLGTSVAELPKEIVGLKLLQTLDVTGTGIKELPLFVCELKKLRCLRVGKGTRLMGRVGELTSLEELWLHSADKSPDFAAELRKLTQLRVLVVHFDEMDEGHQEELVKSLSIMKKLQVLQIWSDTDGKVCPVGWEGSVPSQQLSQLLLFGIILPKPMSWIHHLCAPKLSKLLLQVEILKVQDLEILGKLPSLRSLYLHSVEYNRLSYTASKDEFKVLEYLSTNIELVCGAGALPVIQELEISGITQIWRDVGLQGNMPRLEKATYHLDCDGCDIIMIEMAEENLRQASEAHPNRPTISIKRFNDFNIPFEAQDQLMESVVAELVTRLVALTFSDTGSKAEANDSRQTSFIVDLYSDYFSRNRGDIQAPPTLAVDDVADGSTSLSTKRKGSTIAYLNSFSAADQAATQKKTEKLARNPEFVAALTMELGADLSMPAYPSAKMLQIMLPVLQEQKVGEPERVSETSASASTHDTEGLRNESSEFRDDSMLDRFDSLIEETAKFAYLGSPAADAVPDFRKWLKQSMHNPEFVASVKSFREGGLRPSSSEMSQLVKLVTADFMSLRVEKTHVLGMQAMGDYMNFMAQEKDRLERGEGAEADIEDPCGTSLWLRNRDGSEVSSKQVYQFFGNPEMIDRIARFMNAVHDMVQAMAAGAGAKAQFNAVLWLNIQDEAYFSLEQIDQLPQNPQMIPRAYTFFIPHQGAQENIAEKYPGENSGASVSREPTPKGVDAALKCSQQTNGPGRVQGVEANLAEKHPAENSRASSSAQAHTYFNVPPMSIQMENWIKSPEGADILSKKVAQLSPEMVASLDRIAQNVDFHSMSQTVDFHSLAPGLLDNPDFRNILENLMSEPSFMDATMSGSMAEGVDTAAQIRQQTDVPGKGQEANLVSGPGFMDAPASSYATVAQGVARAAESNQDGENFSRMLKEVLPAVEQALAAGMSSGHPSLAQPDVGKKAPARK